MITGLAHACFTTSNLDRAEQFYTRLGMMPAFEFKDDNGQRTGLYLKLGRRTFIELFEGPTDGPKEGQSFRHICLEVDNMEKTIQELRNNGVTVTGIKMGLDQSHQAWVEDPDGNRIELHQYTPRESSKPFFELIQSKQ